MDPELKSYLQKLKASIQEQQSSFQELRAYLDERFEGVDRRFEQVDRRFEQMDHRFEQMEQRFERVEESGRHTLIIVEDLRSKLQLVAEGFVGIQESREADRVEVTREIDEVKSLATQSYSVLDGRVLNLEEWRERRDRDPIAVIREWLAKPR